MQQNAWIDACGDGPLFQELLQVCLSGQPLEKKVVGYTKVVARTQRNFYKWLGMHPEAKGLISCRLDKPGSGTGILTFKINLKRETRGRRPK
jgi:hypothetical protein